MNSNCEFDGWLELVVLACPRLVGTYLHAFGKEQDLFTHDHVSSSKDEKPALTFNLLVL